MDRPMEELQYPGPCPACGEDMHPFPGKAYVASILDVDGWRQVKHTPLRCRRKACAQKDREVFHNYTAKGKTTREWVWPAEATMHFFFVAGCWGVSVRWLRQMSRRLVVHYASFRGEAKVHAAAARDEGLTNIVPDKVHMKLFRSWFLWRLATTLVR